MYLLKQNGYNVIGGFYLPDSKKHTCDDSICKKQDSSHVTCEKKANMTEQMAKGYEEMSEINLALAEDALAVDNQLWSDILD